MKSKEIQNQTVRPTEAFKAEDGFTLVEMVITILISSLMLTLLLNVLSPILFELPIINTRKSMEEVEEALVQHLQQFGTLPCPASITAAPDTILYGSATDCLAMPVPAGITRTATGRSIPDPSTQFVRMGAVPVRTLDLPNQSMLDGWGNRILYIVTQKLTQDGEYSNDDGGIFIEDAAGNDMTSLAGNIQYILLSHGPDEKGAYSADGVQTASLCAGSPDLDRENCDGDATFIEAFRSLGTVQYDDIMAYKAFIGEVVIPTCGNKGMIYAPSHPEADADNCLDPAYKRQGQDSVTGNYSVPCTLSFAFCTGGWIDLIDLVPGDYLIHWDANLTFAFPQPSQYAVLEFEADTSIVESERIPFTSTVCQPIGPMQTESGLLEFDVDNNTTMRVRMKFFGGANDPVANGCAGATPTLRLIEAGQGIVAARRTVAVDPFRKPQTF